ncbi:MAG: alpha/beta fold hydrolase [Deltaproteobacteria bacterium]|nr:alpha/beta fold hydrolase [Deltaproteobacteria bacterium]
MGIERYRLIASATALSVSLTSLPVVGQSDCTPSERRIEFRTTDNVRIRGAITAPCHASDTDLLPTIIFLNPLGQSHTTYRPQAQAFATDGYRVLSFDPRGWKSSGGSTTLIYPDLVKDVQHAIDWLTAHYATGRIGMTGISEGGAMSLLTAAADSRVSAVASLSGWTNIVHPSVGNTPRLAWNLVIGALLFAFGRPLDLIKEAIGHAWHGTNPEPLDVLEASSPWFHLDEMNQKQTPLLLIHEMDDTLFPINQTVDFYEKLAGPKHLQINRGFHAASSITVLQYRDKEPWASVHEWFDAYVRDERPSNLDGRVRISFKNSDKILGLKDDFRDDARVDTFYLQQTSHGYQLNDTVMESLTPTDLTIVNSPWNPARVSTGIPVRSALKNLTDLQTVAVPIKELKRPYAIQFSSAPYSDGATVLGIPKLRLKLATQTKKGLVIAHLVDIGPDEVGQLITHGTHTWSDGDIAGDGSYQFEIEMYFTAWTLAPGHRLGVVLNGADFEYQPPTLWRYNYKLDQSNGNLKLDVPLTPLRSAE